MNKLFIIIFLSFSFSNISAQTENNENTSEEEVFFYDMDIDEDEVIYVPKPKPSSASKAFLKEGNNRKLYKVYALYKTFDWIQSKKDKKIGVIKDGKIFLPLVFSAETNQKGNRIILTHNRKKGVYDLDLDKWIIPPISDWIIKLNPNLFAVRMYDGLFYKVNSKNEILEKTNWVRFDKSSINSNHYIIKTRDNLFGLYDKKLKKVIFEPNHTSFKINKGHYEIAKNGFGKNLLKSDGTFLFEDWVENIQKVVAPNTGKRPNNFYGLDKNFDYYIVKKQGKKGLVRSDSKVVIPFKYKNILFRGYFWSQNETGKWGVINDEKILIPFKYDEISRLGHAEERIGNVSNFISLLKVRIGNNFGVYEYNFKKLNLFVKCNYKDIRMERYALIVQGHDDKYQLINYSTKQPVFKTTKNAIIQSYQNSFLVQHRNNWTLVNSTGVKRTKQVYKKMQNFHFYIVAKNASNKFGILSNKGKTILPFEYENIFSLDEEGSGSNANIFIIKKGGKQGLFNAYKKQIKTEIIYDNVFKDSQYIYLTKGNDFFEARAFGGGDVQKRENFIPIKKEIGLNKDIFIIDFTPRYEKFHGLFDFKKNKWIIPLGHKHLIKVKEDLFLIQKNNEPVTFVNSKGKQIRKTDWVKFDYSKQVGNERKLYIFKNKKGLFGVYDIISNKEIIPPIYDQIGFNYDVNNYYQIIKNEKLNYADYHGKLMFPDTDIEIIKKVPIISKLYYFIFYKNGKKGVIRSDGEIIVFQDFSDIKIISSVIWLQDSNGKWGVLNKKNNQVSFDFDNYKFIRAIEGKQYFQVEKEGEKLIFVKNKDSFIPLFDYKYKSIKLFHNHLIIETTNGFQILDYSKKNIFGKEFQSIKTFYKHFLVKYDNQWYMVNSKGEKIIDEGFAELANFQKGNSTNYDKNTYAKYKSTNQKIGLINALGKKLTEPIFDDIVYRLSGGFIMVKNGEKLRWYNAFKNEYTSDIEFDSFYEQPKKVYCLSSNKLYYTGNFNDKFYFKELKLPTSIKY